MTGESADESVNREIYDIVMRLGADVQDLSEKMREAGWRPPLATLDDLDAMEKSIVRKVK
ncbi:hypothetical protein D3C87_2064630 [compost metagenome]